MKQELKVIQPNIEQSSNDTGCCTPALVSPVLGAKEAQETAELFAALADPTRLIILSLLAKSEQREVCVCDITASFKLGQPTISHHLKILRDADMIEGEKRGKWVYYSLVTSRTDEIKQLLDHVLKVPQPV